MSLSARTVHAGRPRRPRARICDEICRNNTADESSRNRFTRAPCFPGGTSHSWIEILPSHHRAFHGGAGLSVVNALRFASTRLLAGPAGIDDASARLPFGYCAIVVSMMTTQTRLTRESSGRMLTSSRQCRTALPPFAATANGARIRSAPTGHGTERNPHHIAVCCTTTDDGWSARQMNCEPRDLSPRIILRIKRCDGDAFTRGIALPWPD